jgi:predicted nucleic acid-binding protein
MTDAHLLALAIRRGGRLASFDRGLLDFASEGEAEHVVSLGQ